MQAVSVLLALHVSCLSLIAKGQSLECTAVKFTEKSRECINTFIDKIATNSRDCSASYRDMAACIDGLKDTCLHNQTRQETSEPLAGEVQRLKATERDYCSHGMLSRQSNQRIDGCKKKFYKKVAKCEKKFHGIFNKRLSDSVDLCRLYSKAKRCTKKYLVKYCQANANVRRKIQHYGDPFNPYCSERQDSQEETSLDTKFGRCTRRSYQKLIRNCTAKFVDTLKQNRGKKCKSTFRATYQSCEKETILYCMYGRYGSPERLNAVVDESQLRRRDSDRERLCARAEIVTPRVAPGQCKAQFKATIEACDDKTSETYKRNRADPSLCREYAQAKRCAKRVIKNWCTLNAEIKAFVEFYYDNFNPFCHGHSDLATKRR